MSHIEDAMSSLVLGFRVLFSNDHLLHGLDTDDTCYSWEHQLIPYTM
jgi:hypothetical protein